MWTASGPASRHSTEFLQVPQATSLPFSTGSLASPRHPLPKQELRRAGFVVRNEVVTSIHISFLGSSQLSMLMPQLLSRVPMGLSDQFPLTKKWSPGRVSLDTGRTDIKGRCGLAHKIWSETTQSCGFKSWRCSWRCRKNEHPASLQSVHHSVLINLS